MNVVHFELESSNRHWRTYSAERSEALLRSLDKGRLHAIIRWFGLRPAANFTKDQLLTILRDFMEMADEELKGTYLDSMLTGLTKYENGTWDKASRGHHHDFYARKHILDIAERRGVGFNFEGPCIG